MSEQLSQAYLERARVQSAAFVQHLAAGHKYYDVGEMLRQKPAPSLVLCSHCKGVEWQIKDLCTLCNKQACASCCRTLNCSASIPESS